MLPARCLGMAGCGEVAIVIGSESDREYGERALRVLQEHGVDASLHVYSAHRNPRELDRFLEECEGRVKVYIAMAGLSAALPGYIASRTRAPVIGVPIPAGHLDDGEERVHVASVGIGAAENAALLAVRILGACRRPGTR